MRDNDAYTAVDCLCVGCVEPTINSTSYVYNYEVVHTAQLNPTGCSLSLHIPTPTYTIQLSTEASEVLGVLSTLSTHPIKTTLIYKL